MCLPQVYVGVGVGGDRRGSGATERGVEKDGERSEPEKNCVFIGNGATVGTWKLYVKLAF